MCGTPANRSKQILVSTRFVSLRSILRDRSSRVWIISPRYFREQTRFVQASDPFLQSLTLNRNRVQNIETMFSVSTRKRTKRGFHLILVV